MNIKKQRKNAGLYLKQAILSLLLLLFTIYLAFTSSLTQMLFPPSVNDITKLENDSYVKKHPIIHLDCKELYYTGYANKTNGEITGHYYYCLQNDRCIFLLLDTSIDSSGEVWDTYSERFRLIQNDELRDKLIDTLSKNLDWSDESLEKICIPVIASEPDYSLLSLIIYATALCICMVTFFIVCICNFYSFYRYRRQNRLY